MVIQLTTTVRCSGNYSNSRDLILPTVSRSPPMAPCKCFRVIQCYTYIIIYTYVNIYNVYPCLYNMYLSSNVRWWISAVLQLDLPSDLPHRWSDFLRFWRKDTKKEGESYKVHIVYNICNILVSNCSICSTLFVNLLGDLYPWLSWICLFPAD